MSAQRGTGHWAVDRDPTDDKLVELAFIFDHSGHKNVAGVFTRDVAMEIGGALLAEAAAIPDPKDPD